MTKPSATLLIDIGNSRVKWAFASADQIEPGLAFASQLDEAAAAFTRCWADQPPAAQVVVANVAGPAIAAALQTWIENHWAITPQFVRTAPEGFGVVNGYASPENLGVDRWVALIGARHAIRGPLVVADCGTAITVDGLDGTGLHLGGLITPGLALMRQSLASGTRSLPLSQTQTYEHLARETQAAISSGTRLAAVGLIERTVRHIAQRLSVEPTLLLTGGDADEIAAGLDIAVETRPNLVLEGLHLIAGGRA
jgi:type III pantothenate kinase